MQRCRNCGSSNDDESLYCQDCGEPLRPAAGPAVTPPPEFVQTMPTQPVERDPVTAAPAPAPPAPSPASPRAGMPTIPATNIVLSEGERLWRSYPLLHFRPFRIHARGTLHVTDSRILLHSTALKLTGRTSLLQEVRLETVTGFGSYLDRGLGPLGFLGLLVFAFIGLQQLANGSSAYGVFLLVVAGVVAFIAYRYGRLGLQVFTNQSSVGPIAFGRFGAGRLQAWFPTLGWIGGAIGGVQASDLLYCFPEANADEVVAELGALVFDLNRKGTLEGSHWEQPQAV
jgi:hypothetical protein